MNDQIDRVIPKHIEAMKPVIESKADHRNWTVSASETYQTRPCHLPEMYCRVLNDVWHVVELKRNSKRAPIGEQSRENNERRQRDVGQVRTKSRFLTSSHVISGPKASCLP